MEKNARKVIGFVSMDNPFHDKVAWSGTLYKLRESIEMAGFDVRWIPYNARLQNRLFDYSIRIKNRISRKRIWLTKYHFRPLAKAWAKEIDACPEVEYCDYLFYPRSALVANFTKNRKPYQTHHSCRVLRLP